MLLWSPAAHAAFLYIDPGNVEVFRGDTVTLGLRVDTDEGECINVVDAVIKYDPSIRAIDFSRGNSILSIWVEDPVIDEQSHTITFAGGIPGGYCGRIPGDPMLTNVIGEIVFRSPGLSIGAGKDPVARVWVDEVSQVFLNDGLGTEALLTTQEATITLSPVPGSAPQDAWNMAVSEDDELPADFSITLTSDPSAFSGKYFVVFSALDKQSGIDHYEIMEEPLSELYTFSWGRADAPWVRAQSPYVLQDQTLNSTIRVKAIDKAGNERISVLVPDTPLRSMSRDRVITILISAVFVGIVVSLVGYALHRRRKEKSQPSSFV